MKEFQITQDFPLNVKDFFASALAQPEVVQRIYSLSGNSDVQVSPWRKSADKLHREIKCSVTVSNNFLLKKILGSSVSIQESQELYWDQSTLNVSSKAQVTGSLSDGFTFTAMWNITPLTSRSSRCSVSVQCDFKGSYLADAVEAYGADLVRQNILRWHEACLGVISEVKHEIDSGNEETPGTSEEERAIPGPSELPIDRKSLPSVASATIFRAPVPLSEAARHALTRTASPTLRSVSPPFVAARTETLSDDDDTSTGFVDADAPSAKQDAAVSAVQTEVSIIKTHIAVLQGRLAAMQAGDPNSTVVREKLNELEALIKSAESSRREKDKMVSTRMAEIERRVSGIRSYFNWKNGSIAVVVLLVWPFVAFEIWRQLREAGGLVGMFAAMHARMFRRK